MPTLRTPEHCACVCAALGSLLCDEQERYGQDDLAGASQGKAVGRGGQSQLKNQLGTVGERKH